MQRYLAIKVANLPSAVAAPRTREFRCPPHVQIRNLLYMPGPGGPTGLLDEAVPTSNSASSAEGDALTALDLCENVEELALDAYPKNPCAEEIKVGSKWNHSTPFWFKSSLPCVSLPSTGTDASLSSPPHEPSWRG